MTCGDILHSECGRRGLRGFLGWGPRAIIFLARQIAQFKRNASLFRPAPRMPCSLIRLPRCARRYSNLLCQSFIMRLIVTSKCRFVNSKQKISLDPISSSQTLVSKRVTPLANPPRPSNEIRLTKTITGPLVALADRGQAVRLGAGPGAAGPKPG